MVKGVILTDYTDQGRRAIKDSPDRAEAAKAEAKKLGITVKDLYYTPGGPHDAAIIIEGEGSRADSQIHGERPVVGQRQNEIRSSIFHRGDAQDGLTRVRQTVLRISP